MMGRYGMAALVGLALGAGAGLSAGPSLAQTAPEGQAGAGGSAAGRFLAQPSGTYLQGSRLVGVEVMGQDHVKLGAIEELLIDGTGRVQGVVIGVGGFLGIGEKRVAVPFDLILWNTGDVGRAQTPSASNTAGSPGTAGQTSPNPGQGANANVAPGGTTLDRDDAARRGPATVPVVAADGRPDRALLRLTREDLRSAPEFRYDANATRGR